MPSRQSVRVTYAHKKRRLQHASKTLPSSPLELLPPDTDDLTRTQMAHRMLKRSRRVALAEQLGDSNVEHIREHLAKRIKHTQERVSNLEPSDAPSDADNHTFQTPFPSPRPVYDAGNAGIPVLEQLSPVPVAKRAMSRTSSRNLKENSAQVLASPFSSRPCSAAPSPKPRHGGRSSRRVLRIPIHAKSRVLSGVFREKSRRVLRKDSTNSLKDANAGPSVRHLKHRRYPSSPSTAYMRSQSELEDWIAQPKAFFPAFDDSDEVPSPDGSIHTGTSFYADQPRSCSTPALSRLRKPPDPHGREARIDNSFHLRNDPTPVGDIEMVDAMSLQQPTVHLSGNSIFSSSDEFTIASFPAVRGDRTTVEANNATRNEVLTHQLPAGSLPGSFFAEYNVPLSDCSPVSTAGIRILGPESAPKSSVGEQLLGFLGTSPARGENLVIRASTSHGVPRSCIGVQRLGFPGTSPARGKNLIIRAPRNCGSWKSSVVKQPVGLPDTCPAHAGNLVVCTRRNANTLTSPRTRNTMPTCPPSSPASDLALELESVDIRGDPDAHSDGGTCSASIPISLQARSRSLQDIVAEPAAKKSDKRRPVRNRASTIRASDFAKSPSVARTTVPRLANARRTRSGTIVGPGSKLGREREELPTEATKGMPTKPVQSEAESESDDELLLKGFWAEGLVYLGRPAPQSKKDVEPDELNLGGLWINNSESGSSRPVRSLQR